MTKNKLENRSANEVLEKLGLAVKPWLTTAMAKVDRKQQGYVQINLVYSDSEFDRCSAEITADGLSWQKNDFYNNKKNINKRIFQLAGNSGPRFLIDLRPAANETNGMLTWCGDYALARDLMGQLYSMLEACCHNRLRFIRMPVASKASSAVLLVLKWQLMTIA